MAASNHHTAALLWVHEDFAWQQMAPPACCVLARRRGRPRTHTAWMDIINTLTGLSVEESIRITEDRDKWRNMSIVTAKEQNRTLTVIMLIE